MNQYQELRQSSYYVMVIKLDINENTIFNLNCIDQEITKQQKMAKEYPEFVLGIKESKFEEKYENINQWIEISITYKCSPQSQSIIEYTRGKSKDEKLKICKQLFKICAWMQKDLESAHGNIKPSNIIVDRGQVLLTDFGSQRTFYQNYCADITTIDQQIKRYRHCLFYSCPKILEIYKQNLDYDLRNVDLNQLNFLQNPLQAINADIFSIGIIILDILCPVEELNFNNVTQFYGVNKENLYRKLKQVSELINNEFFVECLETLLGDNLQSVNLYNMYEQLQKIGFESQPSNRNRDIIDLNRDKNVETDVVDLTNIRLTRIQIPNQYIYNFEYSSIKQFVIQSELLNNQQQSQINYSNDSIIDFNKFTESSIFRQRSIFKQITSQRQLQISEQIETFKKIPRDQQINHLLNFNEIIKMKQQDLQEYKENLEKLYVLQKQETYFNKTIIENNKQKILNAYMQVEWREGALNMIGQQVYNEIHDALVFYLTYDEFIKYEQNISISEDKKKERKRVNEAISRYRQSGIIEEQFLKYFPISLLENGNDEKIMQIYVQKNQKKIQLGIEWFDFNEILMQKFISYKFKLFECSHSPEQKIIFKSKIVYDQLNLEQKISYVGFLKNQISGNSDNKEIFEKAQFEIYEMYKDFEPFKREERKYDHNLIKKNKNIKIISETVQKFCEQHVKFNMKFSFKYKVYFRELEVKELENHQQVYQNKQETCYYNGEIIDDIPNGFGQAILNKTIMLVGLFRNNQFISGWSIVQKSRFLVKYITFSIGDFKNGWLQGQGIEKEYKVIESQANQFVFFQLQSKQQGEFKEGKMSDGTLMEYNPQQPNQNKTYNVLNFQKILQPRQSNSNVQVDQV